MDLCLIGTRWDNYFFDIALKVSEMSTCLRRNVGCVVVKDKQIVSTGYNGAPSGVPHCLECPRAALPSGEHLELCIGAHAEQNAVSQAAKHGISLQGGTLYVNLQPCSSCMKSIINAGIKTVNYLEGYPDTLTKYLAHEAGVELIKLKRGDSR